MRAVREQIDQLRLEMERAERAYDLQKVAELRYGRLPQLEKELAELEEGGEEGEGADFEVETTVRVGGGSSSDTSDEEFDSTGFFKAQWQASPGLGPGGGLIYGAGLLLKGAEWEEDGDRLEIPFPFTVARRDVRGLLAFLKEPDPPRGVREAWKSLPIFKKVLDMAPRGGDGALAGVRPDDMADRIRANLDAVAASPAVSAGIASYEPGMSSSQELVRRAEETETALMTAAAAGERAGPKCSTSN